MKKLMTIAAAVLLALSLASCGKKIDSSVWLNNLDDGKKAARAEGKKIFLFFSGDDFDETSANLKEKVFNTEEFLKSYTEKYVLVNLDYSDSRYGDEQAGLLEDIKISERYNVQGMPYFLVLTAEGYVITRLAFEKNADFDNVRITFDEAADAIASFEALVAKTKTGTTEERLSAINEIFDKTEPALTYHLAPLNSLYLSLDKNNASGESAKHLIALTYAKAEDFYLDEHPEKACEEFVKLAKNKILSPSDQQMAYYTAGYLLIQSGSEDLEKIKGFFQKAIEVDPESEEAKNIQMAMNYVQMIIDGEGDDAPNYDVEEAPASEDARGDEEPTVTVHEAEERTEE